MAPQNERVTYATLSDIGLRRSNNQDSLTVTLAGSDAAWQQRGDLFMVADGMGAHAAGELASKLATDTVSLAYSKLTDRSPPEALAAAFHEANLQIHSRGQGNADFRGMGTTSTALLMLPQGALLAHVGDSRGYRVRNNRIEQLTFDHSLVWEMRASGQIQGKVPDFIPKNVITRSLGPSPAVQVDLEGPLPILTGDIFLLCSDGLTGQIQDDEIGMILGCFPPVEAARTLVDLANLRGGPDNITVIVAQAVGSQWATGAGTALPQGPRKNRPVHPGVWILLGVFALAGLGLLAMGDALPAIACLIVAVLLGGGAMMYQQGVQPAPPLPSGRRFGRGPYVAVDSTPNAEFVKRLADTAIGLREAAAQTAMAIDLGQFDLVCGQASAAAEASDFGQAVRCYGDAISFMMAELKRHGQSKSNVPRK